METDGVSYRAILPPSLVMVARKIFNEENDWLSDAGVLVKEGTLMDATIIEAPNSTKNKAGECDPEMHQTKRGHEWHFGMKVPIGVSDH